MGERRARANTKANPDCFLKYQQAPPCTKATPRLTLPAAPREAKQRGKNEQNRHDSAQQPKKQAPPDIPLLYKKNAGHLTQSSSPPTISQHGLYFTWVRAPTRRLLACVHLLSIYTFVLNFLRGACSVTPCPLPVTPTLPSSPSGDAKMLPFLSDMAAMLPLAFFFAPFVWKACGVDAKRGGVGANVP